MQKSSREKKPTYEKTLEQKQTWYSPVANIYHTARPKYPEELIKKAIAIAKLDADSTMLEIGCGTGNATVELATSNIHPTCLEINQ